MEKEALLYFDEITSIVPRGSEGWIIDGSELHPEDFFGTNLANEFRNEIDKEIRKRLTSILIRNKNSHNIYPFGDEGGNNILIHPWKMTDDLIN